MAFGDIEVHEDPVAPLRSQAFHVVWIADEARAFGLTELQRLNGIAAAARKPLLVISARRVTRPALHFADDAEAFVFKLDPRSGVLFNGNDRCAEAYLTCWDEWIASALGLDPEIRVAAANVRLERLSDLRGVGNHVKFPRDPSASEVLRHAA
jgi:hypothetical protein